MQRYVSILRGINVSGQKKIKMDDLTVLYESLGFENVRTYIQSGNVVFDAAGKNSEKIAGDIEQAIQRRYGFEVPVQLRTRAEMGTIVKANPFLKEEGIDIGKLHVTFLERAPGKSSVQKFNPGSLGPDRYVIQRAEVYLYCPGGYGKTRMSNNFIEKQLGVRATTRNWKTVNVLADMVNGTVAGEK
ncbi:MAG: DUF1697 domain-containing protein [Acidiferrobacterales bacterium]|nr:DUF1697 domain-containing protein [Acidiferrobacterales bacterium]